MRDPNGYYQAGDLKLVRISNTVRYSGTFTPPDTYASDTQTVGFWPLTDGSGLTAADSSGHGYDATLKPDGSSNNPEWIFNGAPCIGLRFNGGNYAETPNDSGQFDLGTGTYEFLFRSTTDGGDTRMLATYAGSGSGFLVGLLNGGTHLRFCLWSQSSSLSLNQTSNVNVLDGNWHHIAVTVAPGVGMIRLWLDGHLEASGTGGGVDSGATVPTRLQTLPAATLGAGAAVNTVDLRSYFGLPGVSGPVAQFNTVLGTFNAELLTNAAPQHVTNFMAYANAGSYAGTFFHRSHSFDSTTTSIVQGGGYGVVYDQYGNAALGAVATRAPVPLEYNLPNARGMLAAARTTNINSATSQWFFNARDNSSILDPSNGGGYTVFGRVIGTGMTIVDAIAAVPAYNLGSPFDEWPLRDVQTNQTQVLLQNIIFVNSVSMIPVYPTNAASLAVLKFAVTSTASNVASASITGSTLTVNPLAPGTTTITVQATDVNSNSASGSFIVTVKNPRAQMLTPTPSSTLTNASTTFTWDSGTGASGYALWFGSSAGTYDLSALSVGANLSQTVALPVDGRTLYVRLWSLVNGTWLYNDYTYSAVPPVPAQMLTPVPGTTNSNSSMSFSWNAGTGASQYAIWVGSTSNSYDIQALAVGTNRSRTVTVPVDGRSLYVRLWTQGYQTWVYNDYSYTAFSELRFTSLSNGLPAGLLNGSYNQALSAAGGTGPYAWSWSGNTPPGMTFINGVLSGTPTAIGTYNFTLGLRDNLGTTTNQSASLAVQGSDLSYAMVMKQQRYWQTNTGAAVLGPPSLEPNPFAFSALVKRSPTGTVSGATVQLPDTTVRALAASPSSPYSDFAFTTNFASKAAMDAASTNGSYLFTINAAHDGTNILPAAMDADNYPTNAPHISNWTAAQTVNPAVDFSLTWDALMGGATNDWVAVEIKRWVAGSPDSNDVFNTAAWGSPVALNGTNRSVTIPAGTFTTNQTYCVWVNWTKFGALNTTNYPGATSASGFGKITAFLLNTTGPAQMLAPAAGSTNSSTSVTFTWNRGVNVSQYALWVGTASNSYDLCAAATGTNRSQTVTVPATGAPFYARVWSLINSDWQYNDYSYTAATAAKATMVSPDNGSTNSNASVTFTWSAGVGVSQYALWVGSAPGSSDRYAAAGTNLSATLSLPSDGLVYYVRLRSLVNGSWQYNDYSYTACTAPIAQMLTPTPGATNSSASATFTWNAGTGATQYALWVGSALGLYDFTAVAKGTNLSHQLTMPIDGHVYYVRLWSLIGGVWQYTDISYTAALPAQAAMLTPLNSSTNSSDSVTFTWDAGVGVGQYALWVGSASNSYDLGAFATGSNQTRTVTVPMDARPLWVRLWSFINNDWQYRDYNYTAYDGPIARIQTPSLLGATLAGPSTTLTWNTGTGVSQYALWVGSSPASYDLYAAGESGLSRTLNLPVDGRTLYVRLWSWTGGQWHYNEYCTTAYTAPAAQLLTPTPGSTLTRASTTFTWSSGTGVSQYALWVGSSPASYDLYAAAESGQSRTLNMPVDGRTLYVTVWSLIGGAWHANPYTCTALASGGH